ncbi:hypothetical protein, conserved [Leishmania lindenbergi]|uniref:Uncharacterized protein n=1 Tax=Leishmania lindenbergi TaxID=651832 RepID=A0AAW3A296_9TRYP
MFSFNHWPNGATGSVNPKQQQMMWASSATHGAVMHPAAYSNVANHGVRVGAEGHMPAQSFSPACASAMSTNVVSAGCLGADYPVGCAAPRPASGYYYPPYTAVKQYASQQPPASGVMPCQMPQPQHQATAPRAASPALVTQQYSAATSRPACGAQSLSTSISLPRKGRERPRSGRHHRGDDEATETPASTTQPPTSVRYGSGGGHRGRRRHPGNPPADDTCSTRAPLQAATETFGEVFPDSTNTPNMYRAPIAPTAAVSVAHGDGNGDGCGRRRRRHRRGDGGGGERGRDSSPRVPSDPQIDGNTKEMDRHRHHRREGRGHRDKARSNVDRSESASPRPAGDLADISCPRRSSNRSSPRRGNPPKSTVVAASTLAGTAALSLRPIPVTTVSTPAPQPVTVGSTRVVAPPPQLANPPAASSAYSVPPSTRPVTAAVPLPPPAVQPSNTSKGNRLHRRHRRADSLSLSSSGGSSDASSSHGSSSYSSSVLSDSVSASRPALASPRNHRPCCRQRRRDRGGRRGGHRSPRSASPSWGPRPPSGHALGNTSSLPTDHNASVANAPNKKRGGGILSFFRRDKSAPAEVDSSKGENVGALAQEAALMVPLVMPPRAPYSTSMGSCGTSVPLRDVASEMQQHGTISRSDSTRQHRRDHSQGHTQHPPSGNGAVDAHIPPHQGSSINSPIADSSRAVVPFSKSKGFFGGLFHKKSKPDARVTAAAGVPINGASAISGYASPSSRPSSRRTPSSLAPKARATLRFEVPPTPPKNAPLSGGYGAASMNGTTAGNPALKSKPGLFGGYTKKSKAAASQLQQGILQPMEYQCQPQAQKHHQQQCNRGNRDRRRHENRGHASPVDERGGHRSGGRGRRHTPSTDSYSCSDGAASAPSSRRSPPKRRSGHGNKIKKAARARATNDI